MKIYGELNTVEAQKGDLSINDIMIGQTFIFVDDWFSDLYCKGRLNSMGLRSGSIIDNKRNENRPVKRVEAHVMVDK